MAFFLKINLKKGIVSDHILVAQHFTRMHLLSPNNKRASVCCSTRCKKNTSLELPNESMKDISTHLPPRESLLPGSAIKSKAPSSSFYADPCLSGQFRGALVISVQSALRVKLRSRGALPSCSERKKPSGQTVLWCGRRTAYFIPRGEGLHGETDGSEAQWWKDWSRACGGVSTNRRTAKGKTFAPGVPNVLERDFSLRCRWNALIKENGGAIENRWRI